MNRPTLFIQFGSLINFKTKIDFDILWDELWIDRQLGFPYRYERKRREVSKSQEESCLESVNHAA